MSMGQPNKQNEPQKNETIPSFRLQQPEDQYVINNTSKENIQASLNDSKEPTPSRRSKYNSRPVGQKSAKKEYNILDDKDRELLNKSQSLLGQSKLYEHYDGNILTMQDHQGGSQRMSKIHKIQQAQQNLKNTQHTTKHLYVKNEQTDLLSMEIDCL